MNLSASIGRLFPKTLRQSLVVVLIGSLVATIGVVGTAQHSSADVPTLCSGDRFGALLVESANASGEGGTHYYWDIVVPANDALEFSGTMSVVNTSSTGHYDAAVYLRGPATAGNPGWYKPATSAGIRTLEPMTYSNNTASSTVNHVDMWMFGNYNVYVELTARIVSGANNGCAGHDGLLLGGCNPAERYSCTTDRQVAKPVSALSGNFWHRFDDFSFPGRGPGLRLSRTYNSLAASVDGPFGFGWQSSAHLGLVEDPNSSPANKVSVTQETGSVSVFTPTTGGNYSAPSYTDAVLTKTAGSWTFVRGVNTTMQFQPTPNAPTIGRVTSITDPNNEALTFSYTGTQLTAVSDGGGRSLTFDYQGGPRVRYVRDSSLPQRVVEYFYNAAGEMQWFKDVDGSTTSFTYDAAHRLLTMRDPLNQGAATPHDVVNTYVASGVDAGKIDTQTDRNGGLTRFDYSSVAGSTIVTDPKLNKVRYGFGNGVLRFETDGYGTADATTTSYVYDAATLATKKVTDGRSKAWTFDYIGFDRTGSSDPLLRSSSADYNGRHEPLHITVGGVTTTYTYDAAGNLLTASTPLAGSSPAVSQITTFNHATAAHPGDVTSIVGPRSDLPLARRTTTFHYDTWGNRDSVTDPLGNKTSTHYSTGGFPESVWLPRGNAIGGTLSAHEWVFTRTAVAGGGVVVTVRDPLGYPTSSGHVETRTYDANGNLSSAQDQNLHTTGYVYDAEDQLTEVHRPDSVGGVPVVEKTEYWADGSVKKQIDGSSATTSYGYDPVGRVTTVTDPDTRLTVFSYDAAGNPTGSTDSAGRTVTNTFDDANQLTRVIYSDPDGNTPDITGPNNTAGIAYDAAGRKALVTQSDGVSSSWTYDSLGRLTASNDSTGSVAYEYDLANDLTKITYPGVFTPAHAVVRAYDDAGRMTSSLDWLGNTTAFGYNEDGTATSTDQPGNQRDDYGVDNADRVTSTDFYSNYATSTKSASLTYGRDNVNSLTSSSWTDSFGTTAQTFGYNETNMLTGSNGAPTWTYDSADNLTRTSDGRTQKFTAGDALCATAVLASSTCSAATADATKYTTDQVGSRSSMVPQTGNTVTYVWDQLRQLRSVTPGSFHTSVPGSWAHTLAVKADGTVEAFGNNGDGQLGDTTIIERHAPVDVVKTGGTRLGDIRVADAGAYHSAAIDNAGHLWMWGQNASSQLTSQAGITNPQKTAVQLTDASLSNVAAVALGNAHTLALTAGGAVYAWGNNTIGQLGDGTGTTAHATPTPVSGLSSGVIAIATRNSTSYALKVDGKVWAWGRNDAAQLGLPADAPAHSTPTEVSGVVGATAIAAGEYGAYALTPSGVMSWGLNTVKQLGRTCTSPCATPGTVGGLSAVTPIAIAGGGNHGVALTSTGTVYAWGSNTDGQLGQGGAIPGTNMASATLVSTLSNIGTIGAGRNMTTAVGTDGSTYTFGDNANGQLGDGTTGDTSTSTNQPAEALGDETNTAASGGQMAPSGWYHSLAVRTNGTVAAAGLNDKGQLGDGTTTTRGKPVQVNGLTGVTQVATGLYHSVARDSAGNVWAWGFNDQGQLGDGTTAERHVPVRVWAASNAPAPNNYQAIAVAAGRSTTYALLSDKTVRAWGQNDNGQLGNNTTSALPNPVPVTVLKSDGTPLTDVIAIAAGALSAYALVTGGAVYSWGDNGYGQLGVAGADRPKAAVVPGVTATKIAAGQFHAYGLLSASGGIKAWGRNANGQLGNNTTVDSSAPVDVKNTNLTLLTGATDVAAGGYHGLAVVAGAIKSWGYNASGQLGIGSITDQKVATPITAAPTSGVLNVDAGPYTSAAETTGVAPAGGDLYTWGADAYGQLGDNGNTNRLTPGLVKGALDLDAIPLATTYAYTADGLRTSKTTGGVATSFVWDHTSGAAGVLAEINGNATTSYLYGPDGVAYEQIDPGGVVTYLHHDQLGSIRLATDSAGAFKGAATYDPYGNATTQTGTMPNLAWAGQYRDAEVGLIYMRARYYDPDTAQFLTRDPLEALTRSAYGYVNGDPLNGTDPTGLMCLGCLVDAVRTTSAVVQGAADVVGTVAALTGFEPVAGVAFTIAGAAGVVNLAATCTAWLVTGGASATDCVVNGALTVATVGAANVAGGPSEWANGRAVSTQSDRLIEGGINLLGDFVGWARGLRLPRADEIVCPAQPRFSTAT